jgi:group I intron endonuclease
MPKAIPFEIVTYVLPMMGVYKITNPTGKIYIGKSIDIEKRHYQYKKGHVKSQTALYNSIKKYGWESHKVEILIECEEDKLNLLEEYYINYYNSVEKGLNLTYGGDGGRKSDITKQRISKSMVGKRGAYNVYNPVYQYDLEGNFIQEWKNPKTAVDAMNLSRGAIRDVIDTNKTIHGYRFTSIKKEKIASTTKWEKNKKPVLEYDLENNFIQEWNSAKEASTSLNIAIQHITACCRGERKKTFNRKFTYKK